MSIMSLDLDHLVCILAHHSLPFCCVVLGKVCVFSGPSFFNMCIVVWKESRVFDFSFNQLIIFGGGKQHGQMKQMESGLHCLGLVLLSSVLLPICPCALPSLCLSRCSVPQIMTFCISKPPTEYWSFSWPSWVLSVKGAVPGHCA